MSAFVVVPEADVTLQFDEAPSEVAHTLSRALRSGLVLTTRSDEGVFVVIHLARVGHVRIASTDEGSTGTTVSVGSTSQFDELLADWEAAWERDHGRPLNDEAPL